MILTDDGRAAVRIERTISASPERVYRAWLGPDLVRRWMAPGGFEATQVEIEERVGGHYRVWHVEGEPMREASTASWWSWSPTDASSGAGDLSGLNDEKARHLTRFLTITLHDAGDGFTKLGLVHERLNETAAALPPVADGVGPGWEDVLGRLDTVVSGLEA